MVLVEGRTMATLKSWGDREVTLIRDMCEASHTASQHSSRLLNATHSHTLSDTEVRELLGKIKNAADKIECAYKHLEESFGFSE